MGSTPEESTENNSMSPDKSEPVKNSIARTSFRQSSDVLDIKQRTAVCRLDAAKKNKGIRSVD